MTTKSIQQMKCEICEKAIKPADSNMCKQCTEEWNKIFNDIRPKTKVH